MDAHSHHVHISKNPTKNELYDILSALPLKKKTFLYITEQLHQEHLPHEDVGISLALVAINAILAEKAGKQIVEAGTEFVRDEFRITAIESLAPLMDEFLLSIPRFIAVLMSGLGACLSVIISFFHIGWYWLVSLVIVVGISWWIWHAAPILRAKWISVRSSHASRKEPHVVDSTASDDTAHSS